MCFVMCVLHDFEYVVCMYVWVLGVFLSVLQFVFNWLECALDDYCTRCPIVLFSELKDPYASYGDVDDFQLDLCVFVCKFVDFVNILYVWLRVECFVCSSLFLVDF